MYGGSPVVCVFTREATEPLTSLVKSLDSAVDKNDKLRTFVVFLSDDEEKTAKQLKALVAEQGIKHVPLTIGEIPTGPPAYKIAKDADITVMMWKGTKVLVNHAYSKGKMTEADVKTIISELPKVLGN
jgi:hypothetical protein